jgi:hypothetical protein
MVLFQFPLSVFWLFSLWWAKGYVELGLAW